MNIIRRYTFYIETKELLKLKHGDIINIKYPGKDFVPYTVNYIEECENNKTCFKGCIHKGTCVYVIEIDYCVTCSSQDTIIKIGSKTIKRQDYEYNK